MVWHISDMISGKETFTLTSCTNNGSNAWGKWLSVDEISKWKSITWIVHYVLDNPHRPHASHGVQTDGCEEQDEDGQLNPVPERFEILSALSEDDPAFHDDQDEDEQCTGDFGQESNHSVRSRVSIQLNHVHPLAPQCAAVCRVLEQHHSHVRHSTVHVEYAELHEDGSRVVVDPAVGLEGVDQLTRRLQGDTEVADITSTGVGCHLTFEGIVVQVRFGAVQECSIQSTQFVIVWCWVHELAPGKIVWSRVLVWETVAVYASIVLHKLAHIMTRLWKMTDNCTVIRMMHDRIN